MTTFLILGSFISIFIKSYLLYVGMSPTYAQYAWKNRWVLGHFRRGVASQDLSIFVKSHLILSGFINPGSFQHSRVFKYFS